jgi:hypothetical protein
MAKVRDNYITEGASGKLGRRLVFRHMKDGRTIIATRPDYTGHVWTPDQSAHHSRFRQAAAYARSASKTTPLYAELAKGTAKNAYNIALSDWFRAPVIHEVTRLGDRVRVEASDNVLVARVVITVTDDHGQRIEQGEAARMDDTGWEYITSAPEGATILVEAFDLPGNVARQES